MIDRQIDLLTAAERDCLLWMLLRACRLGWLGDNNRVYHHAVMALIKLCANPLSSPPWVGSVLAEFTQYVRQLAVDNEELRRVQSRGFF